MKKHFLWSIFFTIIFSFLFLTCSEEPYPSLYDVGQPDELRPDPVITNVDPPSAFAGITPVTIYGENFDPSDGYTHTRVYFGGEKSQILSMTSTEIQCVTPIIIDDSLSIKVQVDGAMLFGEYEPYKVERAQIEYGGITGAFNAYGMAMDLAENLYVSLGEGKILQVTPEEEQVDYLTGDDGVEGFYRSMKMGPSKTLYAVRTVFVYVFPEGAIGTRYRMNKIINDFDFDQNLNIHYATNYAIYSVSSQTLTDRTDREVAAYPDVILRALRVYDGYVYVAGAYRGSDPQHPGHGIWRNEILNANGDLGPNELVFDWEAYYGEGTAGIPDILAITFAEDGDLYVGADSTSISNAITVIHPNAPGDYSSGNAEPLYPAVLVPPATNFVWGNDQYLYVNRRSLNDANKRVIRVTMGKLTAPYYGRQ